MSNHNEEYRLHHFHAGELPSNLYLTLTFECTDEESCIARVISVIDLISKYDRDAWPDDYYWSKVLPQWLLETFKSYTPSELATILSNRSKWENLAWTFGSWLDRMRDRDWRWWSLDHKDGKITIYLSIDGYPSSTKALEHLIVTAGGRLLQIE